MRRAWITIALCALAAVLPAAAVEESAAGVIQVGDTAPDFTLHSIAGKPHTLSEALASGPVVLVLYRGVW